MNFYLDAENNEYFRKEFERYLLDTRFLRWKNSITSDQIVYWDFENHVFKRYNKAIYNVLPWLKECVDLNRLEIIEYGCGTGSGTAAFTQACLKVKAYEIDQQSINIARKRCELMGQKNVEFYCCDSKNIMGQLFTDNPSIGCLLLYAVLEHLTIKERIEFLSKAWDALKPGGILVIIETPNRFAYWDYHTSWMPFFHMLPDELMSKYYNRSPRKGYVESIDNLPRDDYTETITNIYRWGVGVSYHEFELSNIGEEIHRCIIADGWHKHMLNMFPPVFEDDLLSRFFKEKVKEKHIGFSKCVLSFIIQKPIR